MPELVETATVPVTSAKIVEAIVRLGKAVHKTTIYPEGHPAIPDAVARFLEGLRDMGHEAPTLSLGVSRNQFLLDGEPIEARNPFLTALAERLFELGIVAIEVASSVPDGEAVRFVRWLAREPEGDSDAENVPSFEGITLTRYDFARVRFGEDPAASSERRQNPLRVWVALMSGLFGGRDTDGPGASLDDPEALAKVFSQRLMKGESPASIASRIVAIGSQLGDVAEPVRESIKQRLGRFVGGLTPELRHELLRVDGRSSRQKLEFVSQIVDFLPSEVVLEVLSGLDREGARIPHQFITLMNKLIGLSSENADLRRDLGERLDVMGVPREILSSQPDRVREVLSEVLQSRLDKDWNPDRYQKLLENLSGRRIESGPAARFENFGDPRKPDEVSAHVAEIALKLLVAAPGAPEAPGFVKRLDEDAPKAVDTGRFEQVHEAAGALRSLMAAPEGLTPETAELTGAYLAGFSREERIEKILAAAIEPWSTLPDAIVGLFRLAGREGGYAALHRLADLEAPEPQQRLRDLLARLDPEEFNAAVARLRTEEWHFLRPLFGVLQRIGGARAVELALTFVGSEDHRVRIEALKILLAEDRRDGQAEKYLERALYDEDPHVAGFAIGQARSRPSPEIIALVGGYARNERRESDDDLRVRAIGALGLFGTPQARDILIAMLRAQRVALFVKQVRIARALEEALGRIGDEQSTAAVRKWRRSPARWISLLLVQGKVER